MNGPQVTIGFFSYPFSRENPEFGVSLEDVDLEFMFYGTKSLIMNKNFSSKFKKKNFKCYLNKMSPQM